MDKTLDLDEVRWDLYWWINACLSNQSNKCEFCGLAGMDNCKIKMLRICQTLINEANAERKKAYWKNEEYYDDKCECHMKKVCSNCGAGDVNQEQTMYCPNCGSRMADVNNPKLFY